MITTQDRDEQRRQTARAEERHERREQFFRCGGYDGSEPQKIISPRPVTGAVRRPSEEMLRECREIQARQDGRNRAATNEHELLTEGRTSNEKLKFQEAPQ